MTRNNNGAGGEPAPRLEAVNESGSAGESRGSSGRSRGNAANLSREARIKGGQRSAQVQVRDEHGQFAGRAGGERNQQQRRVGQGEARGAPADRAPPNR